jgi:DNA-binding FadR family transcriptional regulator
MVSAMFLRIRRRTIGHATDLRTAAEEHRAIYLAIRANDPTRARQAMLDHLRRAETTQVAEEESPPPPPDAGTLAPAADAPDPAA